MLSFFSLMHQKIPFMFIKNAYIKFMILYNSCGKIVDYCLFI